MKAAKALFADDHEVYRAGLAQLLSAKGCVGQSREAGNFDDALDLLADDGFDLACFDLDMPGMNGPETLREVRLAYPTLKLVMISACEDQSAIAAAMTAGADAYITKTTALTEMVDRITSILNGASAVPKTPDQEKDEAETANPFGRPRGLTPRQRHVLKCVGEGMSNKEIARELDIAPGTVKIHVAALFAFFDVHSRTKLMIKAKL